MGVVTSGQYGEDIHSGFVGLRRLFCRIRGIWTTCISWRIEPQALNPKPYAPALRVPGGLYLSRGNKP